VAVAHVAKPTRTEYPRLIASDFTRSILDAIAYEREDGTLVIGAGVPKRWLPLHQPRRKVEVKGDARPPDGILVVPPLYLESASASKR